MRPRIKSSMICRSSMYETSRAAHINELVRNHESFKDSGLDAKSPKLPYTKCFGKLIRIPNNRLEAMQAAGIEIIYM